MGLGLESVLSRRMWFVPAFVVWGLPSLGTVEFLVTEQVGTEKSILFGSIDTGDSAQPVSFGDLVDHRGNNLPVTVNSPRVLLRPHGTDATFVVGAESTSSFKVARSPESAGPVTVDILVIELD